VFEIYDMCLLLRDDPKDLVKLKGDKVKIVKERLKLDRFYEGAIDDKYDDVTKKALRDWLGTNNFEVRERDDDFMWGSLYRYILALKKSG